MTKFDYWRCDQCEKILENCECSANQLMFTLIANYDTDTGYKAHFCSAECLKKYVDTKVKDHHDLPNVKDGDRDTESISYGQMDKEKEKN